MFLRFLYFPCFQTGSAYRDSLNSAVNQGTHLLNIGTPDFFTDLMGVTDSVSKKNGFAADFAFRHFCLTFSVILQ